VSAGALGFELPAALAFGGRSWPIRTDFRDVLRVLAAFEDPNLSPREKARACLRGIYPDAEDIPPGLLQAAYDAAVDFIDHGVGGGRGRRVMDWGQDAPLIFPAVNRAAGFEVRATDYLHWWTFLGYFLEIRDSTYATVLALRQKKYGGQGRLDKGEQRFWSDNRALCELKPRRSDADLAERARLEALLGGGTSDEG